MDSLIGYSSDPAYTVEAGIELGRRRARANNNENNNLSLCKMIVFGLIN
jgi:hypothetical protein